MEYFVIGDIHGEYELFVEILQNWNPNKQQLVLLGDLIDRGINSKKSLMLALKLVNEYNAIYLCGNHEMMFLNWLENPQQKYDHYHRNGGDTTINSLLNRNRNANVNPIEDAKLISQQCATYIKQLHNLPDLLETDHYIFVHAGVNLTLENWQDTTHYERVWIREAFHKGKNITGKTIIFGHTTTDHLFESDFIPPQLWISDNKIGIDGGAVYGGYLHAIVVNDEGIINHYTLKNKETFE